MNVPESVSILESKIKWFNPHPWQHLNTMGVMWPIIHPDHAIGNMGRYELICGIRWKIHYLVVHSYYFKDVERLVQSMNSQDFLKMRSQWIPVQMHDAYKRFPEFFDMDLNEVTSLTPEKNLEHGNVKILSESTAGTDIEERTEETFFNEKGNDVLEKKPNASVVEE